MILFASPGKYTSPDKVIQDYQSGKDFKVGDVNSRWFNKPCSCRDFPGQEVTIYYGVNQSVITKDTN